MKKLYILFLLFILSGCSVNYELDIDKKFNLMENISINAITNEEILEIKNYNSYMPIDINADEPLVFEEKLDDIEYYDIKKTNDNSKINFSYNYDIDKFSNNIFTKNCYEYATAMKTDDAIILSTSKEFLCFEKYEALDDVTITITSKYKLKETNADIVEKHKYTWKINESNANDKYLYLALDTTKRDLNFLEKLKEGYYTNSFTISILILLIGFIIYLIIKRKGDKNNKV